MTILAENSIKSECVLAERVTSSSICFTLKLLSQDNIYIDTYACVVVRDAVLKLAGKLNFVKWSYTANYLNAFSTGH